MCWSSVAKRKSQNTRKQYALQVRYNIESNPTNNTNDDLIPRHKETTPHPADDYIMTNGTYTSDSNATSSWNINSNVLIHSRSAHKWVDGIIDKIEGEWLTVKYVNNFQKKVKKIQKGSEDIMLKMNDLQSLPLSLQYFIKWVESIEKNIETNHCKIIEFSVKDWSEIDKDLKYQYNKYRNDRYALKRIYYDFNLHCNYDKFIGYVPYSGRNAIDPNKQNKIYFYGAPTIIHCLFWNERKLSNKKHLTKTDIFKIMETGYKILELLLINGIVNGDELLCDDSFGSSIFECICNKLRNNVIGENIFDDNEILKNKYLELLIDLIVIICVDRSDLTVFENDNFEQQAILKVITGNLKYQNTASKNETVRIKNIYDMENVNYPIGPLLPATELENSCNILNKLLFRGILPFQFVDKDFKMTGNAGNYKLETIEIYRQPMDYGDNDEYKENNSTAQYIKYLFEKYNVMDSTKYKKDKESVAQFAIISPLVLHPYLCQAKQQMIDLLNQEIVNNYITNNTLINDCVEIMVSYIYINYDLFYPKNIRNNLKIKALDFINNISHFIMDKSYINAIFNKRYNNTQFINYLFENDQYITEIVQSICISRRHITKTEFGGFNLLYKLCSMKDVKISLNAFYYIMISLNSNRFVTNYHYGNSNGCNKYEQLIRFLKLATSIHGNNFNINYVWKRTSKYRILGTRGQHPTDDNTKYTIMSSCIGQNGVHDETMKVIKYILNEYNYDINANIEFLSAFSFRRQSMPLIDFALIQFDHTMPKLVEYLLIECVDKFTYSLNDISKSIEKVIENVGHSTKTNTWGPWSNLLQYDRNANQSTTGGEFKNFIKIIENCLKMRCKSDQDIEIMNNVLKKLNEWMEYEMKIRKE